MADITITIKEDDRTTTIAGKGVATTEDCGLPTLGAPDHLDSFTRVDWATRNGRQYRLTVEHHVPSRPGVMFNAKDKARGEPRRFVTLDGGDLLNLTTWVRTPRSEFDLGYKVIGNE